MRRRPLAKDDAIRQSAGCYGLVGLKRSRRKSSRDSASLKRFVCAISIRLLRRMAVSLSSQSTPFSNRLVSLTVTQATSKARSKISRSRGSNSCLTS